MQRLMPDDTSALEQRLAIEMRRKRREAKRLLRDADTLAIRINRLRRERGAKRLPTKEASILPAMVEQAVISRLTRNVPPETDATQLWPLVQGLGIKSHSTFRSHLRRMREKGLIISPSRGRWRLATG